MNVALISEAGGGKDFLAEYAVNKYGYTRYAFADDVKLIAELWFPHLYGDENNKNRALLQAIGTKFREIDEDVWIKSMFTAIDDEASIRKRYNEATEVIVITDCRMPNEYQALKERGFTFIRVIADEEVRKQRLLDRGDKFTEKDMKHHTESFYSRFECDFAIINNGDASDTFRQLSDILDTLIEKKVIT